MKQREAVFSAIETVMGLIEGQVTLNKDQRTEIVEIVASGIESGDVDFSDEAKTKYNTPEKIRAYTSSLINNWLRKDPRLNGGGKYTPANPGSRSGSGDDQIKALKALRKQFEATGETDKIKEVDAAIEARNTELKAAKTAKAAPKIDMSNVPDELKAQLGIAI